MKRISKVIVGGVVILLFYTYVVVPLREYYSMPGVTVPAVVNVNLQEQEEIQVIETETLLLESINKFQVEAVQLNISVRDARNNWSSQKFRWDWQKNAWAWLWGRSIDMHGQGYVTASFDLSKVQRSDITHDGDVFVVNVGAPNISHVVLPANNISHVTPPYQGTRVTAEDMLRLERYSRIQLERNLRQAACGAYILRRANEHIENALPTFIRLAAGNDVRIRIKTRSGVCVA